MGKNFEFDQNIETTIEINPGKVDDHYLEQLRKIGFNRVSIGVQSFDLLRQEGYLYVDKTARLLELVGTSGRCFLSRPRRFGKSLTLSTLDAMFSGKVELFKGLAVEKWVEEQAEHPSPVLRFDMSLMKSSSADGLEQTLMETINRLALELELKTPSKTIEGMFQDILLNLYKRDGKIVVLIDEYDKPMLDNVGDIEKANAVRQVLRSFYTVLKGCDDYLRFVMLTGISKFSKTGVFSALNNLEDISMDRQYGDIVGYTQDELEENFTGWVDNAADKMKLAEDWESIPVFRQLFNDTMCRAALQGALQLFLCFREVEGPLRQVPQRVRRCGGHSANQRLGRQDGNGFKHKGLDGRERRQLGAERRRGGAVLIGQESGKHLVQCRVAEFPIVQRAPGADQGPLADGMATDDGAVGSQRSSFPDECLSIDPMHGEVCPRGHDVGEYT